MISLEKYVFEKVDECIYKETLDNGLEIYMYPTNKTKNFYITISVKYGARVLRYKIGDEITDVIPGSAHFLEHKVMALSENSGFSKRINKYGSLANAWTNNYGTNYNLFGSKDIYENIKLLLDIFYDTDINEKNVEEEKGIIGEEIDMNKDNLTRYLTNIFNKNLFNKIYARNTVVGERSDIEKITAKSLNKIYSDYYVPNNTFICVCGDFEIDKCVNLIKKHIKKYNPKYKEIPQMVVDKEPLKVSKEYEEVIKHTEAERARVGFKIKKDIFNIEDNLLRYYIDIIFSCYISTTSDLYAKYKKEDLFYDGGYSGYIVDDFLIINVSGICKDGNKFIKEVLKDIKKIKISKEDFDRKKKIYLKSYITDFDNIEDIEYNICMSLMVDGYINFNEYTDIVNMNYEEAQRIIDLLDFDNYTVINCK